VFSRQHVLVFKCHLFEVFQFCYRTFSSILYLTLSAKDISIPSSIPMLEWGTIKVRLHILFANPFCFPHCVVFWEYSVLALVHRPMETKALHSKNFFVNSLTKQLLKLTCNETINCSYNR